MKKTCIFLLLALCALLCAGCGVEPLTVEPVNLAFVAGIADGETELQPTAELAVLPALPGSSYAFISVDGSPACIGSGSVADLTDRGYTETMMERIRKAMTEDFTQELADFTPDSGEIDLASAIGLAARTLRASADESRRDLLVLYCSGRSTTGLIDLTRTPLARLDADSSAAAVAGAMAGTDLSGVEVIWYCCGDMGGQAPLSAAERQTLRDFYEKLLLTLGAESVTFRQDLPGSGSYRFPDAPVSAIPAAGTASCLTELSAESLAEDALAEPLVISEAQLRFQPDSDAFCDPEGAAACIQPLADFLLAHPEKALLVYGTCAGDFEDGEALSLARARAEGVKSLLTAAGVDAGRVSAIGVRPSEDPYYQFGLGTGAEGAVNRKTVLLDRDSALAQQLLGQ